MRGLVLFAFFATVFLAAAFLGAAFFIGADFLSVFFAPLRAFGRFFSAARWAAASAALAQPLSSSVSSNSRAGNCQ